MGSWRSTLVSPDASIMKVIENTTRSGMQVALVVDTDDRLIGVVTDGDVRRAILRNVPLSSPASEIMQRSFVAARVDESMETISALMRRKEIHHLPILDSDGRIVDLKVFYHFDTPKVQHNWVVLMAGGMGMRLRPLTKDRPKPLLNVGGRPLLEMIIESFKRHGFFKFLVSVNYKADMIKEYFGGGARLGVTIEYLEETQELGTAGSLGLIPERPKEPILVMNGDLLTNVDFFKILDFHVQHHAKATMCVREYDFEVPYGVVKVDGHDLRGLVEKPRHTFFVNAGIYVLEPDVLDLIPDNQRFDMTDLFQKLLENNLRSSVCPIYEYWMDIGEMGEYERANGEYDVHMSR